MDLLSKYATHFYSLGFDPAGGRPKLRREVCCRQVSVGCISSRWCCAEATKPACDFGDPCWRCCLYIFGGYLPTMLDDFVTVFANAFPLCSLMQAGMELVGESILSEKKKSFDRTCIFVTPGCMGAAHMRMCTCVHVRMYVCDWSARNTAALTPAPPLTPAHGLHSHETCPYSDFDSLRNCSAC